MFHTASNTSEGLGRCGGSVCASTGTLRTRPSYSAVKGQLLQMFLISFLKLQIIRKEQKRNSSEDENEDMDSEEGTAVLKHAEDLARAAQKAEIRNTTYEVLPGYSENACEYLITLFFGRRAGVSESCLP